MSGSCLITRKSGSSSRQGAQGSLMMSDVLARIEESLGVTKEQSIRACTNTLLLSADNGHATHPNHPEKSDQKPPVNPWAAAASC